MYPSAQLAFALRTNLVCCRSTTGFCIAFVCAQLVLWQELLPNLMVRGPPSAVPQRDTALLQLIPCVCLLGRCLLSETVWHVAAGLPVLSHKEAQLFLQRMAQLNRTGNLEVMRDVWESIYLDLLHRLCSTDSPVQLQPAQQVRSQQAISSCMRDSCHLIFHDRHVC